MRFDIRPFEGAFPITFGMQREQVRQILGPPESSFQIGDGSGLTDLFARVGCNVGYIRSGEVNEVTILPGAEELTIENCPVWGLGAVSDPHPVLLDLDPAPVECVGFWYFRLLGVSTTGYHDDDPAQQAVRVYPQGSRDDLLADAPLADTRKYRPSVRQSGTQRRG